MNNLVPVERIGNKILLIRGQKVMIDLDLAALYQVPTKRLNEQVKRNIERFPEDFMFQLTWQEAESLRSQIATLNGSKSIHRSNRGRHIKYLPYAFTEHGVAMLSCVLNSERAVKISAEDRHDARILNIIEAIKGLMAVGEKPGKKIGFLNRDGR